MDNIDPTLEEYAKKLGIAEASLVLIATYADCPGLHPLETLQEISKMATKALAKTGYASVGVEP